jgi:hypothetical protein
VLAIGELCGFLSRLSGLVILAFGNCGRAEQRSRCESEKGAEKAMGRSRKPLAEVILWSAPLRATSSAVLFSISHTKA